MHADYTDPSIRFCHGAVFVLALLLVAGIMQFASPAFSEENPDYSVTLKDGFSR